MNKWVHPTLTWIYTYLSMLGLKLIDVSERGPGVNAWFDACHFSQELYFVSMFFLSVVKYKITII